MRVFSRSPWHKMEMSGEKTDLIWADVYRLCEGYNLSWDSNTIEDLYALQLECKKQMAGKKPPTDDDAPPDA